MAVGSQLHAVLEGSNRMRSRRAGLTLAAVVLLLVLAPASRAQATPPPLPPLQAFTTSSVDWSVCYSPSTPMPDASGCSGTNDTLAPNTSYTTYDVVAIATGDRLAMPTIFTPAPWGISSSAPVANATLQLDAFCDGGVDTISGGPGDAGASGFEGAAQPWPNDGVWQPYSFVHEPLNNYVPAVKPTPPTFPKVSYDRATPQTIWLGNAIPLFLPPTQQNAALPLDVSTETSAYTAGLRVQSFMLDAKPRPPTNNFLCMDTPFRMVIRSDGITSPSTPGLYPRWATFTSQPDHISGQVTRILDMQCLDVGSVLVSHGGALVDADGDCLASTTDANDSLASQDTDLLPDGLEVANGTPVTNADQDGDAADDYDELFQFTNPAVTDTDGDGSLDKQDDLSGFNCTAVSGACTVANLGDTSADDNCPFIANPNQENYDSRVDWTNTPNITGPVTAITAGPPALITTTSFSGATGDYVTIKGSVDLLINDKTFNITRVSSTQFSLDNTTSAGTGGGTWYLIYRGDATNSHQDHQGDACDSDADNDGMPNAAEAGLLVRNPEFAPPTGDLWCQPEEAEDLEVMHVAGTGGPPEVALSPLNADSDGDGGLDGRECQFGSDPSRALTRFPAAAGADPDGDLLFPDAAEVFYRTYRLALPLPGVGQAYDLEQAGSYGTPIPDLNIGPNDPDADGDKLNDGVEVKWYATDPGNFDTDGDGCSDGREAADVNGNHMVNSVDVLGVVQHMPTGALAPAPVYNNPGTGVRRLELATYDINKDGNINSTDQLLASQLTGNCAAGTGAQIAYDIERLSK